MTVVLDAWAIIELVKGALPAATAVNELLEAERPLMSWINLGEVFYGFRREQGEAEAMAIVRDVRTVVDVVLPDEEDVLAAARVKADFPLSYTDAFAAATAIHRDAELWSGDPELLVDGAPWHWRDLRNARLLD